MSDISVLPEPSDSEAGRWCVAQYFELLNARFEGGYDPANAASARADEFSPPAGIFLVARAQDKPVGCGGLRTAAAGIGEIKRLWVAEDARGLGIGQRLLDELETQARLLGFRTIRLDTNRSLSEARMLYLKNGYREVPRFNDDPYPDYWFEKSLD